MECLDFSLADGKDEAKQCTKDALAGVGVEGRVGQSVGIGVVHRQEEVATLHGRRDVGGGREFATSGRNGQRLVVLNAQSIGVARMDLDVGMLRIQFPQDVGLGRA